MARNAACTARIGGSSGGTLGELGEERVEPLVAVGEQHVFLGRVVAEEGPLRDVARLDDLVDRGAVEALLGEQRQRGRLQRLAGLLLLALPQIPVAGHGQQSWQKLTIGATRRKSVTVTTMTTTADAPPRSSSPDPTRARAEAAFARRWWTLAVLCLSLLIVFVGNSSLNVALPTLSRDLHATTSQLQWVVAAYSLVFAGLLFSTGALGDRFGRKGALQLGLVGFLVGAALASESTEMWQLISCRAVMGASAALIMPSTLSILVNVLPGATSGPRRSRSGPRPRARRGRSDRSRAASCSDTSGTARCSS